MLYRRKGADGSWSEVTAGEFGEQVTRIAAGLIAAGVQAGDRVALLSRTRYEWTLFDYAILAAGGVTVPIYETSSPDQISWIVSDSGAVGIVVETAEHAASVEKVRGDLPELRTVWQIEPAASARTPPRRSSSCAASARTPPTTWCTNVAAGCAPTTCAP